MHTDNNPHILQYLTYMYLIDIIKVNNTKHKIYGGFWDVCAMLQGFMEGTFKSKKIGIKMQLELCLSVCVQYFYKFCLYSKLLSLEQWILTQMHFMCNYTIHSSKTTIRVVRLTTAKLWVKKLKYLNSWSASVHFNIVKRL